MIPTIQTDEMMASDQRRKACLEAAWELEALSLLLPKIVPREYNITHHQIRGVAARINELSSVLMDGLGNSQETAKALHMKVTLQGYED